MKTNHQRDFVAPQDFKGSRWMIHKSGFKAATNRGLRNASAQILRGLRVGYLDVEDVIFPIKNEVESAWNWD